MASNTKWKRANPARNTAQSQKWYRSFEGKLSATYNGMLQRVRGHSRNPKLWQDKVIIDRSTFLDWARNSADFATLYIDWLASSYQMAESPSIDRIDSSAGYCIDNMQWITHRENGRAGANSRWQK